MKLRFNSPTTVIFNRGKVRFKTGDVTEVVKREKDRTVDNPVDLELARRLLAIGRTPSGRHAAHAPLPPILVEEVVVPTVLQDSGFQDDDDEDKDPDPDKDKDPDPDKDKDKDKNGDQGGPSDDVDLQALLAGEQLVAHVFTDPDDAGLLYVALGQAGNVLGYTASLRPQNLKQYIKKMGVTDDRQIATHDSTPPANLLEAVQKLGG